MQRFEKFAEIALARHFRRLTRVIAPSSQSKLMVTVRASKDADLGIAS
jgi:hypothetical protein